MIHETGFYKCIFESFNPLLNIKFYIPDNQSKIYFRPLFGDDMNEFDLIVNKSNIKNSHYMIDMNEKFKVNILDFVSIVEFMINNFEIEKKYILRFIDLIH